jgi:hypothetical protein
VDLQAWREQRAQGEFVLDLGGLEIGFRRLGMLDLAAAGEIPAPLTGQVQELIDKGQMRLDVAEFSRYAEVVNLVIMKAAVNPPVTPEPSDETVGIEEIPMLDRVQVFNKLSGAAPLRPFRGEQEAPVEDA